MAGSPTAGHNGDAQCYHSSLLRLPQLDSAPWFGCPTVQGRTLVAAITGGKSRVMGEKISPGPIPEARMKRLGDWTSANVSRTDDHMQFAVLRREGELRTLEIVIGGSSYAMLALSPLGDGEAVTPIPVAPPEGTRRRPATPGAWQREEGSCDLSIPFPRPLCYCSSSPVPPR